MRPLTYLVAVSQDGFIAGPDGQTDEFEQGPAIIEHIAEHFPETLPTAARQHLGIDDKPRRFDTVIMGGSTYQLALDQGAKSPYGHLDRQVVFSRHLTSGFARDVELHSDNPIDVVRELKAGDGLGVWLCGGGVIAGAVLDEIDELVLKRQPLVLGSGRPLFAGRYHPRRFELHDRQQVDAVTVERYRRTAG